MRYPGLAASLAVFALALAACGAGAADSPATDTPVRATATATVEDDWDPRLDPDVSGQVPEAPTADPAEAAPLWRAHLMSGIGGFERSLSIAAGEPCVGPCDPRPEMQLQRLHEMSCLEFDVDYLNTIPAFQEPAARPLVEVVGEVCARIDDSALPGGVFDAELSQQLAAELIVMVREARDEALSLGYWGEDSG